MKGHRWKLYLIAGLAAAMAATATTLVTPQLVAALGGGTFTLTGKVKCVNSLVAGVWVETDSKARGFAKIEEVNVADGFGWTRYSKRDMPKDASYSLHVGCGRNFFTGEWNLTTYSPEFTAEKLDLYCNDLHPILQLLGEWAFGHVSEIINPLGVPVDLPDYEKCREVPQNSRVVSVPRTSLVKPLKPTPIPTVPTLVPVPTKTTAAPPPPPQPQPSAKVKAYNNYGTVTTAGIPMCRGNPANSLSMPGGTVSQTFTVPAGVRTLTDAVIQIDPAAEVTARLRIYVDGSLRTETNAAAAGDTHFYFPPVSVASGQQVKFSVNFTATAGKIITVYTVAPGRGTLTFVNPCPDGAPNYSITSTALRAVVSGWS